MANFTDTERLDWVLDILSLGDDTQTDRKAVILAVALATGMMQGKTGRDVLDMAMEETK